MQRREWNLLLNWVLLVAGLATFSTGLVLLICFHMGHGAFARSALGVDRLVWLNVHRLSAIPVLAGVAAHVVLHWRAFRGRIAAAWNRKRVGSEVVLYGLFTLGALTGFVAWLVLEGSSPLYGPAVADRAHGVRHLSLDAHHLSSLISLILAVHHVAHRRRSLIRLPVAQARAAAR